MNKQTKILVILIPIIVIIILAISLIIVYLTTDFLKSNETLFYKYIAQDINAFQNAMDISDEQEINDLLETTKYTSNAEMTASYKNDDNEGSEFKLAIEGESDKANKYDYKNLKLSYNDSNIYELDYAKNDETYGVKFEDVIQYIVLENHDLKNVARNAGISEDIVEYIPDTMEWQDWKSIFSFTDDEINQLKETYMNIIINNIPSESYSKQKNSLITVGSSSFTTTAYSLELTQEQINNIYIKLLEQAKDDEIILNKVDEIITALGLNETDSEESAKEDYIKQTEEEITEIENNNIGTDITKITVYQTKGKIVRTAIETSTEKTVIDVQQTDANIQIDLEYTVANSETENSTSVNIQKTISQDENVLSVIASETLDTTTNTAEFTRTLKTSGGNVSTETAFNVEYEKNQYNIGYINNITLVSNLDEQVDLSEGTVILNNLDQETTQQLIELVSNKIMEKLSNNVALMLGDFDSLFSNESETVEINQGEYSTYEINRFNTQFEFYTGVEKTKTELTEMMEQVGENLAKAEVSYAQDDSTSVSTENKKLQSIKLTIEKDVANKQLAESALNLLEDNKKYTVEMEYDSDTGMVKYITITVNN